LQAQADALIAKESATVLKTIHDLMEKHGLTTADIDAHTGGKKRAKKAGAKSVSKGSSGAVKYRHPKTGATWTGMVVRQVGLQARRIATSSWLTPVR